MMDWEAERKEFEEWIAESGRGHLLERETPHGWYKDLTVTAWWTAWCERAKRCYERQLKHSVAA